MKSWIESANEPDCDFPLQNLPFGVAGFGDGTVCCVSAIGKFVVNLAELEAAGLIGCGEAGRVFDKPQLNNFMACGPKGWAGVRLALTKLLAAGENRALSENAELQARVLVEMSDVDMLMPFKVAEYTDFYASRCHATNVGTMFRGAENALPPNWLHIPIGYNGRASTVVVSNTAITRPLGQTKAPDAALPTFGPSKRLDFELELGAVIGVPSKMGQPITVQQADDMIFGYVLLNDWSARDIQAWEYQPLGPFQAKAFATTISPWVVTKAALEAFRTPTPAREHDLLTYLQEPGPMLYDIELEIFLQPEGGEKATLISQTNYSTMYYSAAQQLAHHGSSGCKMNVGDLLGSGTISGPQRNQLGSLLEMSMGGREPILLETGESRAFLEDGDTVTLRGWSQGAGYRIGFGECAGKILPATTPF